MFYTHYVILQDKGGFVNGFFHGNYWNEKEETCASYTIP